VSGAPPPHGASGGRRGGGGPGRPGVGGVHVLADDDPRWRWSPVEQAQAACDGGAAAVQLRAKHAPDRETLRWGESIRAATRRANVLFVMNDRFDLALAQHFVARYAEELGTGPRVLSPAAQERLLAHAWPGNVRELENATSPAPVSAADWAELARRELSEHLEHGAEHDEEGTGPYWSFVSRLERAVIREGLARSRGNQIQAARLLGINRNTLRKKIAELGLGSADGADTEK